MGIAYRETEEYDRAIQSYQKAIEINPKYADAYYHMGGIYEKLGNQDKADECFQKARMFR